VSKPPSGAARRRFPIVAPTGAAERLPHRMLHYLNQQGTLRAPTNSCAFASGFVAGRETGSLWLDVPAMRDAAHLHAMALGLWHGRCR